MKDCAHPSNHHPLQHLAAATTSQVDEVEGNSGQSSSISTKLPIHNASVTDFDRGVVLLKVVPVCVVSESGLALSAYGIMMNDYIEKGYAVQLSEKEAASKSDHTWYLPHHGVVNPNKSKVRVVCDAAAVWGGTSLNKEL